MPVYDVKSYTIADKMSDTSEWPKTEYTISNQGLNVRTPVPGCSNVYKSYDIPKYVFTEAIKTYLPELINTDPNIRNMISNIIKKEIRKSR